MKTPQTLGRRRWLRSPGRYGAANKGGTQQLLERLRRRKIVEGPTSRSALHNRRTQETSETLQPLVALVSEDAYLVRTSASAMAGLEGARWWGRTERQSFPEPPPDYRGLAREPPHLTSRADDDAGRVCAFAAGRRCPIG